MPAQRPDPNLDSKIDDVLEQIDSGLTKIHRHAKRAKVAGRSVTPTAPFSPARIKRTRMQFQALAEDDLLNDDEDEVAEK